jgi:dimethylaniline monooxygenase (N-oxide forming)
MLGAESVTTTNRRQRYVLPKLVGGVPLDAVMLNRWSVLAGELFPPAAMEDGFKQFILRVVGTPQQYGALAAHPLIKDAGITLSQHFLPLVAEGRINTKPWMAAVDGQKVSFVDGTAAEFDAMIMGTGYEVSLPFLGDDIRNRLSITNKDIHLYRFTFDPAVENLAFVGVYRQIGPYFPSVEMQARMLAYTWAEKIAGISESEAKQYIRQVQATPQPDAMSNAVCVMFSRAIGTEPDLAEYPKLARALMFGPLSATSFRLTGPDAMENAAELYAQDASAFGAVPSPEFTPEQRAQMQALEQARLGRSATA